MRAVLNTISFFFLIAAAQSVSAQASLRFFGNGVNDIDRVKIRIDDPSLSNDPGPPIDVGGGDFTIEFWIRPDAGNTAGAVACGQNNNWIFGNIIIDRDRFNQGRNYGIALGAGMVAFGVMNEVGAGTTICGSSDLRNNNWHHVAVQRRFSDGFLWLFVDGAIEAQSSAGPLGDISYPDDGVPDQNACGGAPCTNSDPFIVIAAEKHDAGPQFPSYSGWVDEVRYSNVLRYANNFAPPAQPFAVDANTVGLYHFDENTGTTANDTVPGGVAGELRVGGNPVGPQWSSETPFGSSPAPPPPPQPSGNGGGATTSLLLLAAALLLRRPLHSTGRETN